MFRVSNESDHVCGVTKLKVDIFLVLEYLGNFNKTITIKHDQRPVSRIIFSAPTPSTKYVYTHKESA